MSFDQYVQQEANEEKADKAMKLTRAHFDQTKFMEVEKEATGQKATKRCKLCTEPLVDKAVNSKEGLFHPTCFTCEKCSDPISGSFVRAMDTKWHADCFSCATCSVPLSETFYMHEDKPFCREHFIDASAEKCYECGEIINEEFVFGINDRKFHVGCFKCHTCSKPLEQYFTKNDCAFCLQDFLKQFGEDCAKCGEKISGAMHAVEGVPSAEGLKWHTDCFTCCVCSKHLDDEVFYHEGFLYCREDLYNTFASHCKACGKPIEGPCVNAMDNVWHPECFRCRECNVLLEGSFMMKGDVPYCRNDFMNLFADKCFGCKKPVSGSIINAIGHKWHPECFTCRVRYRLPFLQNRINSRIVCFALSLSLSLSLSL